MNKFVLVLPVIILISILFYYSKTDNKIFEGIPTGNGPLRNRILTVSKDGELIQSNSLEQVDKFHDRNVMNLMYQDAVLRKYVNTRDASIIKSYSNNDKVHNKQLTDIKSELKNLIRHINTRDGIMSRANGAFSNAMYGLNKGFVIDVVDGGKGAAATPYRTKYII